MGIFSNTFNTAVKSAATFARGSALTTYTAGDVIGASAATNLTFADLGTFPGRRLKVTDVSMEIDIATVPTGMTTSYLHLFDAQPTAIADNGAFNLIAADRSKYLGYVVVPTPETMGNTLWSQSSPTSPLSKNIQLASGVTSLYGVLQTVSGAFVGSANSSFTNSLTALEV